MTKQEKLIELLTANVPCDKDRRGDCSECEYRYSDEVCERHLVEVLADYLIENDVTEVVRCENCVYWDGERFTGRCEAPLNGLVREITDNEDYCSYGVRKERGKEDEGK